MRVPAAILLVLILAATLCAATQAETVRLALAECERLIDSRAFDLAEVRLRELLASASKTEDNWTQGEAHRLLGQMLNSKSSYAQARKELDLALSFHRRGKDSVALGRTLNAAAYTEWATGSRSKAMSLYLEAWAGFEAAGEKGEIAKLLYNLGFVATTAAERESYLPRALAAAREAGDKRLEGKVWHSWGDLAFSQGNFRAALEKLNTALPLLRESRAGADEARALISLGRLYGAHGRHAGALDHFTRALAVCRAASDRQGVVYSLQSMGSAESQLGRTDAALRSYRSAVAEARLTESKSLLATSLMTLGTGLHARKLWPEAKRALDEALEADPRDPSGSIHYRRAAALLELGELAASVADSNTAVERSSKYRRGQLYHCYATRAAARERMGDREGALADWQAALTAYEELRRNLAPTDFLKRGHAGGVPQFVNNAISAYYRAGRFAKAFEVAEQARARAFLDLLAGKELEDASGDGPEQPREDIDLKSIASAPGASAEQARELAARSGRTILSYWTAATHTYIWVVPPDGEIRCRRVETGAPALSRLLPRAEAPDLDVTRGPARAGRAVGGGDPWKELHRILVHPVRTWLPKGPARLAIVPHGPLTRLSFAGLADGGRYLVEDYTLSYAPSVALLDRDQPARTAPASSGYLLVADPRQTPRGGDGARLPPLPGARVEAESVARLLKPGSFRILAGAEAAELPVREAAAGKRVIHFATHGVLLDNRPFDSFLALATRSASSREDGRLTAREIYGLDLAADLVMLSACRSGLGEVTGDGVNGLTRAFFYAGTKTVIATLWDVADEPTGRLVSRFYSHYLRHGRKSDALRAAQLEMLEELRHGRMAVKSPLGSFVLPEHPIFWAGFVLIGEP